MIRFIDYHSRIQQSADPLTTSPYNSNSCGRKGPAKGERILFESIGKFFTVAQVASKFQRTEVYTVKIIEIGHFKD